MSRELAKITRCDPASAFSCTIDKPMMDKKDSHLVWPGNMSPGRQSKDLFRRLPKLEI